MLRAYKYRMYPTKLQMELLRKHFGACRFVYNWALEQKIRAYEDAGKTPLTQFDLNRMLVDLKQKHSWLQEVNSQALQQANRNLDSAFTNFFRKKSKFPKFRSRKSLRQSFHIPQFYEVNFKSRSARLPKIGWVKTRLHRDFEGKMKTATVSMTSTGKFFISILVENDVPLPPKQHFEAGNTVGIDVGINHFATLSNGEKVENPRFLKNSLQRLKIQQRRLGRKQQNSKNSQKARAKLARLHERVAGQRSDFLHKLSIRLIRENQAVAVETLNIEGMMRNHHFAQDIGDASWGEFFRQLEYKTEWYGKTLLEIGTFKPSSKICSECGHINQDLTLAERHWKCPQCIVHHDRDVNAAINIKKFALQDQNLIYLNPGQGLPVEPVEPSAIAETLKQEVPHPNKEQFTLASSR